MKWIIFGLLFIILYLVSVFVVTKWLNSKTNPRKREELILLYNSCSIFIDLKLPHGLVVTKKQKDKIIREQIYQGKHDYLFPKLK